jgi:hypothetical protein
MFVSLSVKIKGDSYGFDIAESECDNKISLFLLSSNTAFRLPLDESVKILHCPDVCSSCNSSINTWMLFQYTRSPFSE